MALKKSELYSSLWSSCDELRGGMDASQYKDYVLVLLFIKYISDKYAGQPFAPITIPDGASFADMVALKGNPDIGDHINKKIIAPLATHLNLLDNGHPVNAAVLLFGRQPQRFLISSELKCAHFHGTEVAKPIPSYQVYKGTVFALVDQAVDFVMSKINLSVGTRAESPQAPVAYEIPREVVAEAIVNAVAHRDYTSNGSVQVMLFADRLEVWNPGGLPPSLTLEKLRRPHGSVPGNPLLAEPLYLTRYIERMGTGTGDMIRRCREAGLPEPEFKVSDGFVTIIRRKIGEVVRLRPESRPESLPESLEARVLSALSSGPLSKAQLSQHLGHKDISGQLNKVIRLLMSEQNIEQTIPDKPNIRLNTDLAKKPPECLEYIVVHEMAHLLEPTHNSRFVALMDQFIPKWRLYRDELNKLPVRHEDWAY